MARFLDAAEGPGWLWAAGVARLDPEGKAWAVGVEGPGLVRNPPAQVPAPVPDCSAGYQACHQGMSTQLVRRSEVRLALHHPGEAFNHRCTTAPRRTLTNSLTSINSQGTEGSLAAAGMALRRMRHPSRCLAASVERAGDTDRPRHIKGKSGAPPVGATVLVP